MLFFKDVLKELEEFTEDYYDRYSGIYLKSEGRNSVIIKSLIIVQVE